MAKYRAIIEIDLQDEEDEPTEAQVIDEAVFQAVTDILEAAGYLMTGFKSIVIYQGE